MPRPDELPKVLTEVEADRRLSLPNQRYFNPHRRLMLKAGLRTSEAVSLRPEHLGAHEREADGPRKQGTRDRTLWVGEDLLDELQDWMERRESTAGASDWPLPIRKGTPVATAHLRRSVKQYARNTGIEDIGRVSPHTLRHTFATRPYRDTGKTRVA